MTWRSLTPIIWKEWREVLGRTERFTAGPIPLFIVICGTAVLSARDRGAGFLSAWETALMTTLFAAAVTIPVVSDSFAGERERHTLETLLASRLSDREILMGKIAAVVSYGWVFALAYPATGLLVVNVLGNGRPLLFSPWAFVSLTTISLLATLMIAALGVVLSLRAPTVRAASQSLLLLFFGLSLLPWFLLEKVFPEGGRWLADAAASYPRWTITSVCLVVLIILDLALLFAGAMRFRRSQLVLD